MAQHLADHRYGDRADVSAVRTELRALLGTELPPARVDDALVMVSELMASALDHTDTPEPRLVVEALSDVLRFGVSDRSVRDPVTRPVDPAEVGGNGLRIVQALADEWGTRHHDGLGKTVWFALRTA